MRVFSYFLRYCVICFVALLGLYFLILIWKSWGPPVVSDVEPKIDLPTVIDLKTVSSDEAIQIAKRFSEREYSKPTLDEFYDAQVTETTDSWVVVFDFKPKYQNRLGGGPTVEVSKANGEVRRWHFAK